MEISILEILRALVGLNVLIFGIVLWNTRKVSRLEGRLNNGDFLRCPFYKKGNKACK